MGSAEKVQQRIVPTTNVPGSEAVRLGKEYPLKQTARRYSGGDRAQGTAEFFYQNTEINGNYQQEAN